MELMKWELILCSLFVWTSLSTFQINYYTFLWTNILSHKNILNYPHYTLTLQALQFILLNHSFSSILYINLNIALLSFNLLSIVMMKSTCQHINSFLIIQYLNNSLKISLSYHSHSILTVHIWTYSLHRHSGAQRYLGWYQLFGFWDSILWS